MPKAAAPRTPRDRLDRIVSLLRRAGHYAWAAALVIVIDGIVSLAIAYTRKPTYKSETVILYREGIRSSYLGGSDTVDPARKLGLRLKEMVLSRPRLQKIIEEFHLYPAIVDDRGYVDAVDEMRNHVAFRVRDGDTFGLSFEGETPDRVQQVTARLAEALIEENSRNRAEQAGVTKEFLEAEKKRNGDELRRKEMELARFIAKHPEFAQEALSNAAGGAGASVRAEKRAQGGKGVDPTLLALEREHMRIKERLGMPAAKRKGGEPKLLLARQQAEAELTSAQKELADKQAQFTDQHPDVRAARARVKAAESRLRKATESLATGEVAGTEEDEDADRRALDAQLKKTEAEISAYRSKLKRREESTQGGASPTSGPNWIVALETEWTRLNREVAEARERNQQLEDKQFKAEIAASSESSGRATQMVVVDPAYRPTRPAKVGRTTIAGIGLLVSIVLGLGLMLTCALLDDRLYDRFDVDRLELLPLLVVVPRSQRGRKTEAGEGRRKHG